MDRKTARKYLKAGKLPSEIKPERMLRTRKDPFERVWKEIQEQVRENPGLEAKTIFEAWQRRYGRYRVLPVAGNEYLDEAGAAARTPNFLFDEIQERIAKGPVGFRIMVQLAEDGDTVDDATVRWSEDRTLITFGEISLTAITPDNARKQQQIIFDPIPRVDGKPQRQWRHWQRL
jgi:hypothetical protein